MTPSRKTAKADTAAANTMTILCLAALLALAVGLVGKGLEEMVIIPLLIGLVITLTRTRFGPVLLLGTIVTMLLFQRRGYHFPARQSAIEDIDWLLDAVVTASLLLFTVCHYRLLGITWALLPADRHFTRLPPTGQEPNSQRRRDPRSMQSLETGTLVLTALVFTALTVAITIMLEGMDNPLLFYLQTNIWEALVIFWIGGIVTLAASILFRHVRHRQCTAQESLQYLQDQLWLDSYRDQGRLARWLTWARLRYQGKPKRTQAGERRGVSPPV